MPVEDRQQHVHRSALERTSRFTLLSLIPYFSATWYRVAPCSMSRSRSCTLAFPSRSITRRGWAQLGLDRTLVVLVGRSWKARRRRFVAVTSRSLRPCRLE